MRKRILFAAILSLFSSVAASAASICVVTVSPNFQASMSCDGELVRLKDWHINDNGTEFLSGLIGKGYKVLNISSTKDYVVYTLIKE